MPRAKEIFLRAILGTRAIGSPVQLTVWVSNLFMASDRIRYCGLVRGPHVAEQQ